MSDLKYMLTHPICRAMRVKAARLAELAGRFPLTPEQRERVQARIDALEAYLLPKPTPSETRAGIFYQKQEPIRDEAGHVIGQRHHVRKRRQPISNGRRPMLHLVARHALDLKLLQPERTWDDIAGACMAAAGVALGTGDWGYEQLEQTENLKRAVSKLKSVLKRERLWPMASTVIHQAQSARAELDGWRGWGE